MLTRTALPVGQGAFYSESFTDVRANTIRHIVYDCGALDNNNIMTQELPKEIDGLLAKGDHIDILFISHFDADHVNGVMQLAGRYKIDRIVLPEITKNLWYLYVIGAYRDQYMAMAEFANFLSSYQGQIIEVGAVSEEGNNDFGGDDIDVTVTNGHQFITSGKKIKFGNNNSQLFWCYIPMNYAKSAVDLSKLKSNILKITLPDGSTMTEQDLADAGKVASVTPEIKHAFVDSKFTTNLTSLVVYSGPSLDIRNLVQNHPLDVKVAVRFVKPLYPWRHCSWPISLGYLYTGDAVMNDKRCNSVLGYIQPLNNNIGTLQIPHHGSAANFSAKTFESVFGLSLSKIFCFASFGTSNKHRHPSTKVLTDLALHGSKLWGVTEEKASQFVEHVYIHW